MEMSNPRYNAAEWKAKQRYRVSVVTKVLGDLNSEKPAQSTYVTGFLTLNRPIKVDELQEVLKERLMAIPRFRSVYIQGRKAYFEEVAEEDMDWDYHFRTALEGEKPTLDEVADYIATDISQNFLDNHKPLWQITFIPESADGGGVLVTNFSHVIGDGVSQVEVLYRLLDDDMPATTKVTSRPKAKRKKKKLPFLTRASIFIGGVFDGIFATLGRPDPYNSLKLKGVDKVSGVKQLVFTDKIELARVKEVKNKIEGATLNDVFMALMSEVLKRYYEESGEKPKKISASFPINLRKSEKDNFDKYGSPHNIWAYGVMKFNLKYKSYPELFRKLKRTLDRVKLSPSPIVQMKIGAAISPILPLKERNKIALNLANKATAQLSNVPGPASKVTVGGYDVEDLTFQLFSPLGLYLGLITYNGTLSCSINTDSSVADPKLLAKHWIPAFEDMYEKIMAEPDMLVL